MRHFDKKSRFDNASADSVRWRVRRTSGRCQPSGDGSTDLHGSVRWRVTRAANPRRRVLVERFRSRRRQRASCPHATRLYQSGVSSSSGFEVSGSFVPGNSRRRRARKSVNSEYRRAAASMQIRASRARTLSLLGARSATHRDAMIIDRGERGHRGGHLATSFRTTSSAQRPPRMLAVPASGSTARPPHCGQSSAAPSHAGQFEKPVDGKCQPSSAPSAARRACRPASRAGHPTHSRLVSLVWRVRT